MVIQSDDVDPQWIGQEWLHKTACRLSAVGTERVQIPASLQYDLFYADVGANWREAVSRIYAFLGRELTPETLRAMSAYVDRAARKHHFASHRYRLEDFGLLPGEVRERLSH
jgi:hypothetical protein